MNDDPYLTTAEFAALPFTAQAAVWRAHAAKRVQAVKHGQVYRYHREQVLAVLAETAEAGT